MNHFLIIASQGCGNALLRGLLNAHSQLEVMYQWMGGTKKLSNRYFQWDAWEEEAKKIEKKGLIWGNDIVFQPMIAETRGNVPKELIQHIDHFKMIWSFRRPGKLKKKHDRSYNQWDLALSTYWQVKDACPERIIWVSFEDMLVRPRSELRRICDFLTVRFERTMLKGLNDTGNPCFDYGKIMIEKL